MRTLVIGAAGFVGGHLIREFSSSGHEVIAADMPAATSAIDHAAQVVLPIDIIDPTSIRAVLEETKPEWLILLAAQSSVKRSWEDPAGTIRSNIIGSANLLEAIRLSGQKLRILLVGSSEEYGMPSEVEGPLSEERPLSPSNPYAVTKVCQEDFGRLYLKAYSLDVIFARAFNHIGPGQRPGFVVPDLCSSIVDIERGKAEPILKVGNLSAIRDFTDVRDVVRAYRFLFEKGESGQVYNIGSGRGIAISSIVDKLVGLSRVSLKIEVDPVKYRPIDVKSIVADIAKIKNDIGWEPLIPIEKSLLDSLEALRLA